MIMVFIGILMICLFGYLLTLLLRDGLAIGERVFLSFPLGIGLFTFLIFMLGQVGYRFNMASFSILLITLSLFFIILIRKKRKGTRALKIKRPTYKKIFAWISQQGFAPIDILMLLAVLALVARSLILNLVWPPETWDTLSLYDFRAKRFYETENLAEDVLTSGWREAISYNYSYPFLTSLSHTYVYVFGGDNPRLIYSLFYISLIGAFYCILRKNIPRSFAGLITVFLAADPEYVYHSAIAYSNLPYALYFGLGSLYLLEYLKQNRKSYIILSATFIGLSTWTRSQEPFWLLSPITLFMISLFRKKMHMWLMMGYTFFILFIRQSWSAYVERVLTGINWEDIHLIKTRLYLDWGKILPSLNYTIENVFLKRKPVSFILASSIFYLLVDKKTRKFLVPLLYLLLATGMVLAGTYFFSINYKWWSEIGGSVTRMTMFFQILFYYFAAVTLFDKKDGFFYTRFVNKRKQKKSK